MDNIDGPLIKINLDPPEKIAELYDVGPGLAARIVSYRNTHGYFDRPEDLAKVDGIGPNLATTLGPHIDWQAPAELEPPKERNWRFALFCIVSITALFWLSTHSIIPGLRASLFQYQNGASGSWVELLIGISGLLLFGFSVVMIFLQILSAMARSRTLARRFNRYATLCAGLIILAMVSFVLARGIHYQFYSPNGWPDLLGNSRALIATPSFIFVVLVFGPTILVLWRPEMIHNPWLARAFNTATAIVIPLIARIVWVYRHVVSLWWILAFLGFGGLYIAYRGLTIIRTGQSFLSLTPDYFWDPTTLARRRNDTRHWMRWIATRLPDPEEQKALKRALDEAYPPSKWRTVAGAIVFGAGSWMVLTALGAIVEWFVQGWLVQWLR